MNIEENNFYDPIVKCADVLGYLHMSENHRGLIGTGTVNWDELFKGLVAAQYSGPLVLESFSENNPDLIAAIRLWRPPQQSSDYLAREGLTFLQDMSTKYGLQIQLISVRRVRCQKQLPILLH
jgi:D-psicose/D-tagatose/L-ribulose 3-epimerase